MLINGYNLKGQFLAYCFLPDMSHTELRKFLKDTGLFLADILYNAVIIIVLVVLIRSFLISPFRVVGSSMADTLENKEFILIDKISYILGDIHRGDPIVFLPPSTSKDGPKFEEVVTADQKGMTDFDFSHLKKGKDSTYCTDSPLGILWFCKDKVTKDDLIYFAPQKNAVDSLAKETDWSLVKSAKMDDVTIKKGLFTFEGMPNTSYTVRVYDSEGPDYFVKRVIGIPGDTVKIENGRVYVKGAADKDFHQIDEPFLNAENKDRTYVNQRLQQSVYQVPEGNYFVMGDNRNHSNDSRAWLEPITQEAFPFVPKANISGRVMVVLWPLNDVRLIHAADL